MGHVAAKNPPISAGAILAEQGRNTKKGTRRAVIMWYVRIIWPRRSSLTYCAACGGNRTRGNGAPVGGQKKERRCTKAALSSARFPIEINEAWADPDLRCRLREDR